jgi:hypothetical protein
MTAMITAQAANYLGVKVQTLLGWIRRKKVREPQRDGHGFFVWTEKDLEVARQAMKTDRRRKAVARASA